MTRLDCALMAAGGMRIGTAHAVHHATHRSVFGKRLLDQPAMVNVLADLAVDSEAATTVVHAAGRRGRPGHARRRSRGGVPAGRAGGDEVLVVQALVDACGRVARMPRRQRLHRGLRPAAAVPRGAARLDLGGLRQRRRAGHAARDGARAGRDRGVLRRARTRRRHRRALRRRARHAAARSSATPTSSSTAPGTSSSGWRCCCRVRCCCATATRPSPTRSSRRGWPATGASPTARCRPASTPRPSWSGPRPSVGVIESRRRSDQYDLRLESRR